MSQMVIRQVSFVGQNLIYKWPATIGVYRFPLTKKVSRTIGSTIIAVTDRFKCDDCGYFKDEPNILVQQGRIVSLCIRCGHDLDEYDAEERYYRVRTREPGFWDNKEEEP